MHMFFPAYDPATVVVTVNDAPSVAVQSEKESSNINVIMSRYARTGVMPVVSRQAMYGEIDSLDFKDALDVVRAGEHAFSQLSSKVRRRFNNDPAEYLSFLEDPNNLAEAEFLGITVKKSVDKDIKPVIIAPKAEVVPPVEKKE